MSHVLKHDSGRKGIHGSNWLHESWKSAERCLKIANKHEEAMKSYLYPILLMDHRFTRTPAITIYIYITIHPTQKISNPKTFQIWCKKTVVNNSASLDNIPWASPTQQGTPTKLRNIFTWPPLTWGNDQTIHRKDRSALKRSWCHCFFD